MEFPEQCCSLCKGTFSYLAKEPKETDWLGKPVYHAPYDEAEGIVSALADEVLCSTCLTPNTGIGCQCSRDRLYTEDLRKADEWLQKTLLTHGDDPRGIKASEAQHLLLAVQRRRGRRAGLTPDEMTDERLGLMQEWGIEPKPVVQPRTSEASHLPV